MKRNNLNTGRDWRELQETNSRFIVLDSNNLIVSCNDRVKQAQVSSIHNTLSLDSFWLDSDQRTFHLDEFKKLAGKDIKLLFMPSDCEAYRVQVFVEKFHFFGQEYYSLFIKDDSEYFELDNIFSSHKMVQSLNFDLNKNLLDLHYQPQINILDNSLYGVEVLSRWTSKEFGRIAPNDFITLAEKFGLIAKLDLWVLRNACHQLAVWRNENINIPLIAVNFSPLSLSYPNLKSVIKSILDQTGILPSSLVLEVTESKKIKSSDSSIDTVNDLYSMGINISLDDFGTGYSNFKRLLKLPISQLKLDRAFVNELPKKPSKELSEAVLAISKAIGAVAIAEGVETKQQLSCLKDMGYEIVQGYIFSPPLSKSELEDWFYTKKQC